MNRRRRRRWREENMIPIYVSKETGDGYYGVVRVSKPAIYAAKFLFGLNFFGWSGYAFVLLIEKVAAS